MKRISYLLPALLLFAACGHKTETATSKKFVLSDTMMHMIALDTVRNCNITGEVTLTGEVASNENSVVKIFPRGSGQVLQAPLSLGDHVSKGQVLAVIRSADIAGSYADLASANADISIAKRQMDNQAALYKNGISSEREYNEAKENYQKALAVRNKIESTLRINGGGSASASGTYTLTSPIDGYIVEKKIAAGNFIRSDATDNLFTVSDLKKVWVYANVYEVDIPKIKEGYEARVRAAAYPERDFYGTVDKIGQVLDPQSKALRVRVTIDNREGLLKPDMFARVMVSNKESQRAICIPTQSIVSQDGRQYVVIYNRRDSLDVSEVQIVKTVGDRTFISEGVQPGQLVVTKEQLLIFNQLLEE
jgi:cobalt-zinc-cadmium efflux system membrane fusion protein